MSATDTAGPAPANSAMSGFEPYLTLWVAVCIIAGIALGQFAPAAFQAIGRMEISTVVESAGLETSFGKPAHPLAQVVGTQGGLLLSKHATQPLHKEQVERADMILVMEWEQRNRVIKLYPQATQKVFLLRQFYDQSVREVADPYSGTLHDF